MVFPVGSPSDHRLFPSLGLLVQSLPPGSMLSARHLGVQEWPLHGDTVANDVVCECLCVASHMVLYSPLPCRS